MTRRRTAACAGAALLALSAASKPGNAPAIPGIVGARPSYGPRAVAAVPNAAAIVRRIWVPGLDAGYDPQGLTVAGGALFVAGYRSGALTVRRGPCRIFRLDPASGAATGHADVPPPCGHAGGLADDGDGTLYLADTHTLFDVPLRRAFASPPAPFRRHPLGPGLVGALAASASGAIWLGTYKQDGPGRLFRFPSATLARLPDGAPLTVADAVAQVAIPSYAQGAAIDRDGRLWVARSNWDWGELDVLDPVSGRVERRDAVAPAIEGIAFDDGGRLWAVSEAGARHVYDNFLVPLVTPFFPLVFALDPARLGGR